MARRLIIFIVFSLVSCSRPLPYVLWEEGRDDVHRLVIYNAKSLGKGWSIWFSQMPQSVEAVSPAGVAIENYMANSYRIYPEAEYVPGSRIEISYKAPPLPRRSWAPEGFHLQKAGGRVITLPADYAFLPVSDPEPEHDSSGQLIPQPKHYEAHGGSLPLRAVNYILVTQEDKPQGWYKIEMDGQIRVYYTEPQGKRYAEVTLGHLAKDGMIARARIEDWPDFPYRGLMLDVARNFTSKANLFSLIDRAAERKLNYLHLHLADDEGWRLEIPGLPDLTSYGSAHYIPQPDGRGSFIEKRGLFPSYCGDGLNDPSAPSSGFYSRKDFMDILEYAHGKGINVIPEIDIPAHSRAAIKSMEHYEARTGDASFRLSDPGDQSSYLSAQGFTDNVICVALPSVYVFMEKVFDEIISMYDEAEVPLAAIHIGGDEIAEGAWTGSPACRSLMLEQDFASVRELKDWFLLQMLDIARRKGVRISGWQEILNTHSPLVREAVLEQMFSCNYWLTLPEDEAGKVVLSLADYTYADQAYSASKLEPGHHWAGYIDEKRSSATPAPKLPGIMGVQVQLFTETVRSFDDILYHLFPKMEGAFNRSWNASPSEAEQEAP